MQNVAYVVLVVGFLWQVYQSALHGGDVRGLGTCLIKYVVTAVIVMNYGLLALYYTREFCAKSGFFRLCGLVTACAEL
jgi:TRAP-type mannitol/chloroaromatic compound transport system permease small subunit